MSPKRKAPARQQRLTGAGGPSIVHNSLSIPTAQIPYNTDQNKIKIVKGTSEAQRLITHQRESGENKSNTSSTYKRSLCQQHPSHKKPSKQTTLQDYFSSKSKTQSVKQPQQPSISAAVPKNASSNLLAIESKSQIVGSPSLQSPSTVSAKTNKRFKLVYSLSTDQPKGSDYKTYKPLIQKQISSSPPPADWVYGHDMPVIESTSTFRIILQNPNGINPNPYNLDFMHSLQTCYDRGVAAICLSETNVEWQNYKKLEEFRTSLRNVWDASAVQVSTSSERFHDVYKPGGTALAVCGGHWTSRIICKGSDPYGLGRWSFITLRGVQGKVITIVTVYRVCGSKSSSGEKTAYMQQYRLLTTSFQDSSDIDPRRQCILDLQAWISSLQKLGHDIVLAMDANENITGKQGQLCPIQPTGLTHVRSKDHNGSLMTLMTTCGLHDVLSIQHPTNRFPSTYSRGKNRIDYILVSSRLVECVEHSGMMPFFTFFVGDHRPLFIDLNSKAMFGDTSYEMQRPNGRGLQLRDPRLVARYNDKLITQLHYHNIPEKVAILHEQAIHNKWTIECECQYEKIDNIITDSMLFAERSISKRYSVTFDWSPIMIQSVNAMRYWLLRLKQSNGLLITDHLLSRHRKLANLPMTISTTVVQQSDIICSLRAARKEMYSNQRQHSEHRQNYLEDLAEAITLHKLPWLQDPFYASTKVERLAQQVKSLINRERSRTMHRKIKGVLSRSSGGGLSRVDVPDTTAIAPDGVFYGNPNEPKQWKGPWISITDPKKIAEKVASANIAQFNQARDTPFASRPLADALGPYGITPLADSLLNGVLPSTVIPKHSFPETIRLLQSIGTKQSMSPVDLHTEVTSSQFCEAYKCINEKRSSSPSCRHIGHYKAILDTPMLTELYAKMMSLPFMMGFSPHRWQLVSDVMLEKDSGSPKIHRLRIIQLSETDFNQAMRIVISRPLGFLMEDNNLMSDIQYGSRSGRMCLSPVLNKQLTFDIARLAKIVLAIIENDAMGAFDRIVQVLGYLLLRRLGLPDTAIIALGKTWGYTRHNIKTAYGTSTHTYGSTKRFPLFGAGQGSTVGPFFWLLLFCLMAESMDPSLRGLLFVSACTLLVICRFGDAFVDDSGFGCTSSYKHDSSLSMEANIRLHELQVIGDLTKLAQHYDRLLFSTGGALNLQKCLWILISWVWKNGRATLATIEQAPGEISLTSGLSTTLELIPRIQPTDSFRTLGIHASTCGIMKKAKEVLRGHSIDFGNSIRESHLLPDEAYFAFMLYFYPKISYSLPVSTFTQTDCNSIQAPALMAFLPKIRLNRYTKRAIIFGPLALAGLQLRDVYSDQGIGQIRLFLGHLRNEDHTGKLLLTAMSYHQILSGSATLFLNLPFPTFAKWTEKTWLSSLWQFLHQSKLKVQVSKAWLPCLTREGDAMLMSTFISLNYRDNDLLLLNRCRVFHQVLSVADIAIADGTTIDPAYKSSQPNLDRHSKLQWPIQGCPSSKAWKLWNQALVYLEQNGTLQQRLGKWISSSHQQWRWMVCTMDYTLYHQKTEDQWESFHPVVQRRSVTRYNSKPWYFLANGSHCTPPDDPLAVASPKFNIVDGDLFTISNSSSIYLESNLEPLDSIEYISLTQALSQAPPFFQRLIGPVTLPTDETLAAMGAYLTDHTLLSCCDGSFSPKDGTGSHAWLFADSDGIVLWSGAGPIDGHPDLMSSYRTELGGLTTILYLITLIVRVTEVPTGSITVFCDNKGALENVFEEFPKRGIFPLLAVDYDLLGIARDLYKALPVTVHPEWVKGHYTGDDRKVQHDLNDVADLMAGHFREHPPVSFQSRRLPLNHPSFQAVLLNDGSSVTSKLVPTVYHNLFYDQLAENICQHSGWTKDTFNKVDWAAHGAAFRSFPKYKQITLVKLIHGLWNTGAQKVKFKQSNDGLCPCCKIAEETTEHIYCCEEPSVKANRMILLAQFQSSLATIRTPPKLISCIMKGMNWWLHSTTFESIPSRPIAPTAGNVHPIDMISTVAFTDQTALGWKSFFRGRISCEWSKAYAFQSQAKDRQQETLRWSKLLVKKLWDISLKIWDYRNGVLHGRSIFESRALRSATIHERVTSLYDQFSQNPSIVSTANKILFTRRPLDLRLGSDDDYLSCWIRSVEVAISQQDTFLQTQCRIAARFFKPTGVINGRTGRSTTSSLIFVQPSSSLVPTVSSQLDQEVCPTAFLEASTSHASSSSDSNLLRPGPFSERRNYDSSDSSLAGPSPFFVSLDMGGGSSGDSSDSTYRPRYQPDVIFQADSSEISLGSTTTTPPSSHSSEFTTITSLALSHHSTESATSHMSNPSFLALRREIGRATRQLHHQSITFRPSAEVDISNVLPQLHSPDSLAPAQEENLSDTSVRSSHGSRSPPVGDLSSSSTVALTPSDTTTVDLPPPDTTSSGTTSVSSTSNCSTITSPSTILRRSIVSEVSAMELYIQQQQRSVAFAIDATLDPIPMDTPSSNSLSSSSSFSADSFHTSPTEPSINSFSFDTQSDDFAIREATRSAISWLYTVGQDPHAQYITPRLITAITHLPVFYASSINRATVTDANYIPDIDWTLVPSVLETNRLVAPSTLNSIPPHVRHILLLDDVYHSVGELPRRYPARPRYRRDFPPAVVYLPLVAIPHRELDDPPDPS